MNRLLLTIVAGIATWGGNWARSQTVTSPLETSGPIVVTPFGSNAPFPKRVACQSFHEPSWTRVAADAPIVVSALPYVEKSADDRPVAYFTNHHGDLLQCIDSSDQSGCGARHLTYRRINGKWQEDGLRVVIIC